MKSDDAYTMNFISDDNIRCCDNIGWNGDGNILKEDFDDEDIDNEGDNDADFEDGEGKTEDVGVLLMVKFDLMIVLMI